MSLPKDIARLADRDGAASIARLHEDWLTSLPVMAWMVEARDPCTGGQRWRVSRFAVGHGDEGIPLHECVTCGPILVVA